MIIFFFSFLVQFTQKKKKKKRVGVTYYIKTRKWWRISDSVCGQRTFFCCCCFCLVYGQSSHEENETLCLDSSDLISFRYLIWFDSPSSSQTKIRIDLICFVCLYVPPLVSPQSDDFNCCFFFLCVGRVQRPFHVTTQPKCISFFIGRLAWNRTAEVSRVTLLSGTCVVFSFFLTCQSSTSNQRIFMKAIYSEKWRKTRTNYLKLKSPNLGKKLGEKTKKQQNFVRI